MATSCDAPAKRCIAKTPSGNPLPRRGQVKENIAKHIVAAAVATATVLVCDKAAGGGKKGGGKRPAGAAAGAGAGAGKK